MNKEIKKYLLLISLPVISGVLLDWVLNHKILLLIVSTTKSVWNYLNLSFSVPLWGLILIFLLGFFCKNSVGWLFKKEPHHFKYTTDNIIGVSWEWEWNTTDGEIWHSEPVAYCPKCSFELKPYEYGDKGYSMGSRRNIKLKCDKCEFEESFKYHRDAVVEFASKEIDRKVKTGEYKDIVN